MKYLENLIKENNDLSLIKNDILNAINIIINCYKNKHKLLICGNGGSCSDSAHITGELMKSFVKKRKIDDDLINELEKNNVSNEYIENYKNYLQQGLPCIDLTAFNSLNTAILNDSKGELIFANSVLGFGEKDDVLIVLTTSGNSKNVIHAVNIAKAKKLKTICLTGNNGGLIRNMVDVCIVSPKNETYKIQEDHIKIYHTLCLEVEDNLF